MQGAFKILSWAFLAYAVYCLILFLLQRHVIFPRGLIPVPEDAGGAIPGIEKSWLDFDGGSVETWLMPAAIAQAAGPAPAVIVAHGNAELIDFTAETFRPFTRLGLHVLLVEYPGYGRSLGRPAQDTITRAFVKAYDHLAARTDVDGSRIVLLGRSLGGGAVCALAAHRPAAALLLMSTFTGTRAFAPRYLVPGFVIRDPFDNLSLVRSFSGPVLIIHGRSDEVIPFAHGQTLAKACRNGRLLAYDCGHNDCPPDWGDFWRDTAAFLRTAGIVNCKKIFTTETQRAQR